MNDLVTQDAPKGIVEAGVVAGAKILSLIPTTFEGVWRMAQVISRSPFCPKDMSTPEACASAIMLGLDVGLTPIQAVQSIAVINNRPSIWGDAALALCLANTVLCEDVAEEFSGDPADPTTWVYTCTAKRKGRAKPTIQMFSQADAVTAGLWKKSGPWTNYPRRMIQLRARAFALRDAFPDILKGLAIREEMEDVEHTPARGRGADTPRPPGSEIPDAEVREIPAETAKPAPPENADGAEVSEQNQPDPGPAEKQPEDKPRAKRKPNGWQAKVEAAKFVVEDGLCVKDELGSYQVGQKVVDADLEDADLVMVDNVIVREPGVESPIDALKRMLTEAKDLIALDQVVTKDDKGKPTAGSKLFDPMSDADKAIVREFYRRRKVELGGVPKTMPKDDAQPQDQQQGDAGQQQGDEHQQLFDQISRLFAEAPNTDTLDACMNQFDEQISDMPKQMREAVEDLYTKAQERLAEASAKDDGQKDHVVDTGAAAEKDPATMTADEYVAYAEAYIANAQSADWLKKRFFGENGIRQDLKLPSDVSNRLRALRTAKGDELNAAGKV